MILMLWITPRIYPRFILILFYRGLDHNLEDLMIKGPDHLGPGLGQFWQISGGVGFFLRVPPLK